MDHFRKRFINQKLNKTLKWSPVISLIGMRQSGKTTLLKSNSSSYFTLDDDQILFEFERGDWSKLENAKVPIMIDECQKLGKVFDRVKLMVDQNKKPAYFLLTGSVRFLSKKNIRESLTGRTATLELLPLLIGEAHQKNLRSDIFDFFKFDPITETQKLIKHFELITNQNWCTPEVIFNHIKNGGLPGICFKRDAIIRKQMLQNHIDTILGRDLPSLYPTKLSLERLKLIFREICLTQGSPIQFSEIARRARVTPPTIATLVDKFEALFLIRKSGKTIYPEDSAISRVAIGSELLNNEIELQSFVFRELLGQFHYGNGEINRISEYRTRGGAIVPFVLEFNDGKKLAISIDGENQATEKSIRGIESFLKKNKQQQTRAIIFTLGKKVNVLRNGILILPIETIC